MTRAPEFDAGFREQLETLFAWRRDVRRFRTDAVDPATIQHILHQACLSPSVGNSQPWRFVLVEDADRRAAIEANFREANAEALAGHKAQRAAAYARLKLAGLTQAPVHLAVFADPQTTRGHGLGRATMPETIQYSVVGAIQTIWLSARALGLGMGWVSILDPVAATQTLDVPDSWQLIAYLCIGWPEEEHLDPELQRAGWETRGELKEFLFRR